MSAHAAAARVAVVIPFFQREPGILAQCLRSIAAQQLPAAVTLDVIVVDDGSPQSPDAEVEADLPEAMAVRVVRQDNAGPAAARNRGLDAVAPGTDFVAFIDSDDRWSPDHLSRALAALGTEADFYFCDSEVEPGVTEFARSPVLAGDDAGSRFDRVPGQDDVWTFRRGEAAYLIVADYLAHTSTVVFRWAPMADLRFDPALRHGGEDHLLWVQMADRAREVRFSRAVRSHRGRGVNLYRDALLRASPANIRREACRARAFRTMAEQPHLPAPAVALARRRAGQQEAEIAAILLHPAGMRAALSPAARHALATHLRHFWPRLPLLWLTVIGDKMTRRRRGLSPIGSIDRR